ncbi:MAG: NACHT domain-containing protein [Ktedonobacteraceae bacterium]
MTQEEQPPRQVGIQSNSGGGIKIEQSKVNIAGGDMHIHTFRSTREEKDDARNRKVMLDRVEGMWVPFLKDSLFQEVLLMLELHEQPDSVMNPWSLAMQETKHSVRVLPANTHITKVYDDANGLLLILGEPGVGKTTLLLDLLRELLSRARTDDSHPVPIIFNLSSWAVQQLPLASWLIQELDTMYQIQQKLGEDWIERNQILPLLDGLDEVDVKVRHHCVEAINDYRRMHGIVPTVICCRQADYDHLLKKGKYKLQLQSAVKIQPLSQEKIENYLSNFGEQLDALRLAVQRSSILQELASTPLMLSILMLAYHEKTIEDIPLLDSRETQQNLVFQTYVNRMLQRRHIQKHYPSEQTLYWLQCLVTRHNQTQFYIERMQADWLANKQLYQLSSNLVVGCVLVLLSLLAYWLFYGFHFGPFIGLIDGLIVSLSLGFVYVSLDSFVLEWFKKSSQNTRSALEREKRASNKQYTLGTFLESEILFGCLGGILVGPLIGFLMIGPQYTIFSKLMYGLYNVLIIGLLFGLIGRLGAEIRPAEVVTWSRGGIKQKLGMGVFVGLCTGLVLWPIFSIHGPSAILFGLLIGLACASLIAMSGGLSHQMLKESKLEMPNQGIRRSLRNGVSLGLMGGSIGGALIGLACGIEGGLISGLVYGLSAGIFLAGMIGYREGGRACIQHFTLRVLLWHSGVFPLNLPQFLDYCAEYILLKKIGGSYVFVHRLLGEYFASPTHTLATFCAAMKAGNNIAATAQFTRQGLQQFQPSPRPRNRYSSYTYDLIPTPIDRTVAVPGHLVVMTVGDNETYSIDVSLKLNGGNWKIDSWDAHKQSADAPLQSYLVR